MPWYALCHDVLPQFGRSVECRVVRFDPETGELDLAHLAELVDERTKIVCVGGVQLPGDQTPDGPHPPDAGGYPQPTGQAGRSSSSTPPSSHRAPSSTSRPRRWTMAFSFHKVLAPFGAASSTPASRCWSARSLCTAATWSPRAG